jgi:hypothetical protein
MNLDALLSAIRKGRVATSAAMNERTAEIIRKHFGHYCSACPECDKVIGLIWDLDAERDWRGYRCQYELYPPDLSGQCVLPTGHKGNHLTRAGSDWCDESSARQPKTVTVWVLLQYNYDRDWVLGVYAEKDAAMAALPGIEWRAHTEREYWGQPPRQSPGTGFTLQAHDVKE